MVIQFLDAYQIYRFVPSEGATTYADIANATGVEEDLIKRFLRHAMTMHIFDENEGGKVINTARSRSIADNPLIPDAIKLHTKELSVAGSKNLDAIKKWGNSAKPNETGHNLAFDSYGTFFDTLMQDPGRITYYNRAMQFATSNDSWNVQYVQDLFDWSIIDKPGAIAVDIGGGLGQISIFLAGQTTELTFVVQDLPHVVAEAQAACPKTLSTRVTFEPHDFFQENTLTNPPDLFFMRWILHDWGDEYATQILKNLVSCMSESTRLLIIEHILQDGPETRQSGKRGLDADMIMRTVCNGRERTLEGFRELLAKADKRFVIESVACPTLSSLQGIVVGWNSHV